MLNDFTGDLSVIEKLGDFPNTDDGLSPENLKKKFDEGPKMLGQYLNEELVPAVRALQSASGCVDAAEVRLHPLSSSQDSVIISAFLNKDETGGVRLDNMFAQDDAFIRGVKDGVEDNDAVNLRQLNALSKKIIDAYDFLVFPDGGSYVAEDTISDLRAVKSAGRILVCVLETENQQLLRLPMVKEEGGAYHFSAVCEGVEWYVQIDGESNVQVFCETLSGTLSDAKIVTVIEVKGNNSDGFYVDAADLERLQYAYENGQYIAARAGSIMYQFIAEDAGTWLFANIIDGTCYHLHIDQTDGSADTSVWKPLIPYNGFVNRSDVNAIFGNVTVGGDYLSLCPTDDSDVQLWAFKPRDAERASLTIYDNVQDDDQDVWLEGVADGVADNHAVNVRQLNTKITAPSIAEVGQTLVVKEVDENGKPVSWECADAASEEWELLADVTIEADVQSYSHDFAQPQRKIRVIIDSLAAESATTYSPIDVGFNNVAGSHYKPTFRAYVSPIPSTSAVRSVYEISTYYMDEIPFAQIETFYHVGSDRAAGERKFLLRESLTEQYYGSVMVPEIVKIQHSTYGTFAAGTRYRIYGVKA